MPAEKERCPWCGSDITREKFEEIESRIRDEERERLTKHEAEMKKRFDDELRGKLEAQKHSIETQQRLESQKKIATIKSELDESVKKVKELEVREMAIQKDAQDEAEKNLKIELDKAAQQQKKELDSQRLAHEKSRDVELGKVREELSKANAALANQIATIISERDSTREELKTLKAREAEIRKEVEHSIEQKMKDRLNETENREKEAKKAHKDAEKKIVDVSAERDRSLEQLKKAEEREAAIRKQVKEQEEQNAKVEREKLEQNHREEMVELRKTLDNHRDQELLKQKGEFHREREGWKSKMKEFERKLEQKTANEIGEGAEIDLFERLRAEFPHDHITRIDKGKPGADIQHEVMYKGDVCGRIVYDSKNRQSWRTEYVTKLRQDQLKAEADHAILTALKFPSGEKELCIQSEIIVVSPARAVQIVEIIRKAMVQMHLLGLSSQQCQRKTGELYTFITSNAFIQRMEEAGRLATETLDIDVEEKKSHDRVWKKRGITATRLKNVLREIDTDISAIVEGTTHFEAIDDVREPAESSVSVRLPR